MVGHKPASTNIFVHINKVSKDAMRLMVKRLPYIVLFAPGYYRHTAGFTIIYDVYPLSCTEFFFCFSDFVHCNLRYVLDFKVSFKETLKSL